MAGTSGDNQIVVVKHTTISQYDLPCIRADLAGLPKEHIDVLLIAEDRPYGAGDIGRGERGRRHLVQHRLKKMVILPIDDRDPHRRPGESGGRIQAREAAANDDYVGYRCWSQDSPQIGTGHVTCYPDTSFSPRHFHPFPSPAALTCLSHPAVLTRRSHLLVSPRRSHPPLSPACLTRRPAGSSAATGRSGAHPQLAEPIVPRRRRCAVASRGTSDPGPGGTVPGSTSPDAGMPSPGPAGQRQSAGLPTPAG